MNKKEQKYNPHLCTTREQHSFVNRTNSTTGIIMSVNALAKKILLLNFIPRESCLTHCFLIYPGLDVWQPWLQPAAHLPGTHTLQVTHTGDHRGCLGASTYVKASTCPCLSGCRKTDPRQQNNSSGCSRGAGGHKLSIDSTYIYK